MSEDLYIAPGLAGSAYDIDMGPWGTPWIETLAMISLLRIGLLNGVVLVILGLVWLGQRPRGVQPDKSAFFAYVLAFLVIISLLKIPGLVPQVNNGYLDRNMMIYLMGPSQELGSATTLTSLLPLAGILILALAAFTLWAWLVRR